MPVLMRIKREAIMPNGYSLDIVDCHMLGSAIGDLSQSRVLIRAEAIACNTHTGEAIEKRINAYAVDSSDGLAGIQGDVVFKSGAMIANSMKAEFLGGFASALSPQSVQSLNTSPSATQLWQTQNIDQAVGAGLGQGLSGASNRIAEYYMNLAEEAHPVIELIPGIEVDFIVQAGMTLNLRGREKPYTNNKMGERTGFYNSGGRNQVDIPDIPDIPSVSINLN
jgi:conjugal transfer pilus assembly protein TraB